LDLSYSVELKLDTANNVFEQAFRAVLEAENAGANVTNSVTQLNHAAELLVQAENFYAIGDLETAAIQADLVIFIAEEVSSLCQNAKQLALISSQKNFLFTTAFIIIGICVFLLLLIISWRLFKRYYIKKIYKRKPGVTS
jgi:hypothetical protein